MHLKNYFGKRPVVMILIYYRCTTMCIAGLETLVNNLTELPFNAGREFDVVSISIDPRETPALAAGTKREYLKRYSRPGTQNGWHFLTGKTDQIKGKTL